MIWFTKQADGFRGWVNAVRNNGELRTGLAAGDFTVTVVDPDDDASATPSVTESTEKPGVYYFDITSGFVTTNGVGEYAVTVEIDTKAGPSGAPHVVSVQGGVFKVSANDVDSLSTAVQVIQGLVHDNAYIDTQVWSTINGQPRLTSARVRTYDTEANATTHGATGLRDTHTLTATYDGSGNQTSFLLTRSGS